MAEILIGVILKPQGIKGEVKVKAYSDDLDRFLNYGKFFIDGFERKVERGRHDGSFCYVKFVGINSMNEAEALRNKKLYIPSELLSAPKENEYYHVELIGSRISINGKLKGVVEDIFDETRNVVVLAEIEGKKAYFPLAKKVIERFDRKARVLYLKEKEMKEVTVFED